MGSNEGQLFAPYGLFALVPIELPAWWWPGDFDGDCHQEKDGHWSGGNRLWRNNTELIAFIDCHQNLAEQHTLYKFKYFLSQLSVFAQYVEIIIVLIFD